MSTTGNLAARLVRPPGGPDVAGRDGLARPGPGGPGRLGTSAGDPGAAGQGRDWRRRAGAQRFTAVLPPGTAARVPEEARKPVLAAADRLMRGEWETLGVVRTDLERPDWFRDPVTGRRSAPGSLRFPH